MMKNEFINIVIRRLIFSAHRRLKIYVGSGLISTRRRINVVDNGALNFLVAPIALKTSLVKLSEVKFSLDLTRLGICLSALFLEESVCAKYSLAPSS